MAVDLADLVEFVKAEVNVPGVDTFTDATDDNWVTRLQNAFWHARLRGAFVGYEETDGIITPISGTEDLSRTEQQLIILVAALNVVRSSLRNANTVFRAKAGPVEFETQQSANTLKTLLDQLEREFRDALEAAKEGTDANTVAYFDAVIQRTDSMAYGDTWFVR